MLELEDEGAFVLLESVEVFVAGATAVGAGFEAAGAAVAVFAGFISSYVVLPVAEALIVAF